jgi:hypothetical protein
MINVMYIVIYFISSGDPCVEFDLRPGGGRRRRARRQPAGQAHFSTKTKIKKHTMQCDTLFTYNLNPSLLMI